MKTRLAVLLCLALAVVSPARAQDPATTASPPVSSRLTSDQLEQLLGPIALYPDALIALILPAATAPADVVLASRYLKDGGNPAEVASRAWDESVKSLVHYPQILQWLDGNLAWTKQVGDAFANQPDEVMNSIQRLRAKARALGALVDAPQKQVAMDGDVILIIPEQPDIIYVPYYDSGVVFEEQSLPDASPFLTFSPAFAAGPWLLFDCDWRRHTVWFYDRQRNGRNPHDWRHPAFPGQPGYVSNPNRRPWQPPPNSSLPPPANVPRPRDPIVQPAPFSGARPRPTVVRQDAPDHRTDLRPDRRNTNPNQPVPVSIATAATFPPPQASSPADQRVFPPRARNDPVDPPRRTPSVPTAAPNAAAVTSEPPLSWAVPPPRQYPFGLPPVTPVAAPITRPLVTPLAPPPATSQSHSTAAAPAASAPPRSQPASPATASA